MPSIQLHQPNSSHPDLAPESVPYDRLMGQWFVIASTLPLWKNKRDVSITYSAIPGEPATTFDDLVQYRSATAKPDSSPSEVRGIDRLETDVEGNGARWKWRGKGFLKIASSHWQLLGFSLGSSSPIPDAAGATEADWVVTYFSSTLFTPAGLDIYVREPSALSDDRVDELVRSLEGLGGEIEALVKNGGMFRIPHSSAAS
ncbi:hypothetical protein JCM8097_001908 [Rhodosporidiobolus ruineniae]